MQLMVDATAAPRPHGLRSVASLLCQACTPPDRCLLPCTHITPQA
jgi:hypothetical protein